jgi:hypothetical protein
MSPHMRIVSALAAIGAQNRLVRGSTGAGVCRLFIGPRDAVPKGEFLLRIGDLDPRGGTDALGLRGTAVPNGKGSFTLFADEAERTLTA